MNQEPEKIMKNGEVVEVRLGETRCMRPEGAEGEPRVEFVEGKWVVYWRVVSDEVIVASTKRPFERGIEVRCVLGQQVRK